MIEVVSKTTELRPGFVQSHYKKTNSRAIVLLFDVKQGAQLPSHKHPECQFGYTFSGEYDFVINGVKHVSRAKHNYLMDAWIEHSAVATTDYYSMDFKFVASSRPEKPASFDLISVVTDMQGTPRGEVMFGNNDGSAHVTQLFGDRTYRLPALPAAGLRERILVVSDDSDATINGSDVHVKRMEICRIADAGPLDIGLRGARREAFLFEI